MTISRRQVWAPGLVSLVMADEAPAFTPGQFFQLGLLGPDGVLVRRSYSAASAPGQPLEFLVSEVEAGALTPRLCALGEGDRVQVDDTPLGYFTLAEVPPCDVLWLVATGTGLGPFLSMLRTPGALDGFAKLVVVHGAPTCDRLAYAREVQARSEERGAVYVPCISREDPPSGGLRGRITTAFETGALEARAGHPIDTRAHVLLCGNPGMIDDMVRLMRERGLEKHRRRAPAHFNFEKYWS